MYPSYIFVSIPKYKYSYNCIPHKFFMNERINTHILVSMLLYKNSYNYMYPFLIIVNIYILIG